MAVRLNTSPKDALHSLGDLTFDDLANEIVETYTLSNRIGSAKNATHWLNCLLKYFKGRSIKTITTEAFYKEYVPFARKIRPNGNLNEERKFFVMIMHLSWRKGLLLRPPGKVPKPDIDKEVGRELTDSEISKLLLACGKSDLKFQIKLALKTGMRKRELLRLEYAFIDWDMRLARLPPWYTKTRKGRVISLDEEVVTALLQRQRQSSSRYIFPSPRNPSAPLLDNKKGWDAARKRAGVFCRWHDLRHTAGTRMVRARVPLATVSRFLGMSQKVLLRVYNHVSVDDLREAANAIKLPTE